MICPQCSRAWFSLVRTLKQFKVLLVIFNVCNLYAYWNFININIFQYLLSKIKYLSLYIPYIYIVLKTGFTCKWSINITIMNKFVKITGKVISSNINWGK